MKNKIILDFPLNQFGLADNKKGRQIYEEQVKDKLNINDMENGEGVEIVFPDQVSLIASSFVQGFSNELISKYGIAGFKELVKITASSEKISKDFYEDL